MEWAALIAWIATAAGGFVLLAIWLSRGGMQQGREPGTKIRPPLILSHFGLAATGLVIWIIYLASDSDALAWQREPVSGAAAGGERPAEQHFPVPIVALHGLLAVTTVVLVFLTAIGVGGS